MMLTATMLAIMAVVTQSGFAAARGFSTSAPTTTAYDVSYPQCGLGLPGGGSVGIVGVTDGLPWSSNPCFAAEYRWAAAQAQPAQLYMNTANPETASSHWAARAGSGPRTCTRANLADRSNTACAYNYGWNSAKDAVARARAAIGAAGAGDAWWLDVETGNSWNGRGGANAQDLQGSVDYLRGVRVVGIGFYSTPYQWGIITGGWHPAAGRAGSSGDWIAGAGNAGQARGWCSPDHSFSGGAVGLVQYAVGDFDGNYVCPVTSAARVRTRAAARRGSR